MTDQNAPGGSEEKTTPVVEETNDRLFTQSDVDRIVSERLARDRKDRSDYDDLKAKAKRLGEVESALAQTESLAEALKTAEARTHELEAAVQITAWKDEVARQSGVDPRVLHGNSLDEIMASAQTINEVYPRQSAGYVPSEGGGGKMPQMTREEILAITDDAKRKAAIAENLDLFE
jgi:hypothetical protein